MSAAGAAPLDDEWEATPLGRGIELPFDLAARVKAELAPGEKVAWVGTGYEYARPFPLSWRIPFVTSILCLALFSLLFFLTDGKRPEEQTSWSLGLALLLLCCMLIGLTAFLMSIGAIVTNSIENALAHRRTCLYALTQHRAISWKPHLRGQVVSSLTWPHVRHVGRVERSDASGDLVFLRDEAVDQAHCAWLPGESFENIPSVRYVESIARRLIHDGGSSTGQAI